MNRSAKFVTMVAIAAGCLLGAAQFTKQKQTHLGGHPSSMVRLHANLPVGTNSPLTLADDQGQIVGEFTLPKGAVLIVTDLVATVNGSPVAGMTRGGLIHPNMMGYTDPGFAFDATKESERGHHFAGGVVWSIAPYAINAGDSKNAVFLEVLGYIVKDQ